MGTGGGIDECVVSCLWSGGVVAAVEREEEISRAARLSYSRAEKTVVAS
jgi:hypothetical protein